MDEKPKPKVFVFVAGRLGGDCLLAAVAEDGAEVASHVSSTPEWGRNDMWRKTGEYAAKYPGGYELVWVDDWKAHPFLSAQSGANRSATAGETELDL